MPIEPQVSGQLLYGPAVAGELDDGGRLRALACLGYRLFDGRAWATGKKNATRR